VFVTTVVVRAEGAAIKLNTPSLEFIGIGLAKPDGSIE